MLKYVEVCFIVSNLKFSTDEAMVCVRKFPPYSFCFGACARVYVFVGVRLYVCRSCFCVCMFVSMCSFFFGICGFLIYFEYWKKITRTEFSSLLFLLLCMCTCVCVCVGMCSYECRSCVCVYMCVFCACLSVFLCISGAF